MCCENIKHMELTADQIYDIVLAFKTIQFLMVIAIAIVFS